MSRVAAPHMVDTHCERHTSLAAVSVSRAQRALDECDVSHVAAPHVVDTRASGTPLSQTCLCATADSSGALCVGGPVTRELEPSLNEHVRVVAFACARRCLQCGSFACGMSASRCGPLFDVARSAAACTACFEQLTVACELWDAVCA